jgi:glutaredoxin
MIKLFVSSLGLLFFALLSPSMATEPLKESQTVLNGSQAPQKTTPVVIYTLTTCPHCMEAKEYFTANNIPFINREVDSDDHHMEELMKIYDQMGVPEAKRGVPLIIIGESIRLQGFNKEKVQDALRKILQK